MASVASVVASSGFWSFLNKRGSKNDATTQLLLGLAYEKVTTIGLAYIERGWITTGELGEYGKYYFYPYKALGGNGPAERIWNQVNQLPIRTHTVYNDIFSSERIYTNVRIVPAPGAEAAAE